MTDLPDVIDRIAFIGLDDAARRHLIAIRPILEKSSPRPSTNFIVM
ncbi:hypothetical protein WOA01_20445 [Methylocystis sp. IM2]